MPAIEYEMIERSSGQEEKKGFQNIRLVIYQKLQCWIEGAHTTHQRHLMIAPSLAPEVLTKEMFPVECSDPDESTERL